MVQTVLYGSSATPLASYYIIQRPQVPFLFVSCLALMGGPAHPIMREGEVSPPSWEHCALQPSSDLGLGATKLLHARLLLVTNTDLWSIYTIYTCRKPNCNMHDTDRNQKLRIRNKLWLFLDHLGEFSAILPKFSVLLAVALNLHDLGLNMPYALWIVRMSFSLHCQC